MPEQQTRNQPLQWPFDCNEMPSSLRALSGIPFIGPEAKVYQAVKQQLLSRSADSQVLWQQFSVVEIEAAKTIATLAKENLGWPNVLFIPEDPLALVLWDRHSDLGLTELVAQIEQKLHLRERRNDEWLVLLRMNFGDAVRILSHEQCMAESK